MKRHANARLRILGWNTTKLKESTGLVRLTVHSARGEWATAMTPDAAAEGAIQLIEAVRELAEREGYTSAAYARLRAYVNEKRQTV
jgi:hypothetical protein